MDTPQIQKNLLVTANPPVYEAVWAVGVLKPKIEPNGLNFSNQLDVKGTAFWLQNEKILITCAHVVTDLLGAQPEITGLLFVGKNGDYTRAFIPIIDHAHDLAVLQFADQTIREKQTGGLLIAEQHSSIGEKVAYAGFPFGMQLLAERHAPTYTEGIISSEIKNLGFRKELQISGPVAGGFSGSPIVSFSEPQKVLGVLANSPSKEAGDANIFMAISWEHIKALASLAQS